MKKKWFRRISTTLVVLLVLLAVSLALAWKMLRERPAWYPEEVVVDPAVQRAAAARAENEVKKTLDWASAQQAEERARLHAAAQGGGVPATTPATSPATNPARRSLTVKFTEQELNAAFDKWDAAYGWTHQFGEYVSDPRIVLHDGRLIFAGTVHEMGSLISLHFKPRRNKDGGVRFELSRILGGKLPLPEAVFAGHRDKITERLRESLPDLQREAEIKPDGSANDKAVAAASAKLLLQILDRRPGELVLFLAANQGTRIPVRVAGVGIEKKTITMTVELLTAAEREELLARIREPYDPDAEDNDQPLPDAAISPAIPADPSASTAP